MPIPVSATVTIERILPGGLGLAHAEGLTLFVALAAPGDVVRVRLDRIRGKVAFASIEEVIEPSSVRVEPPCPYFGVCGGCDFQQLNYQAQLDTKTEMIRDCLRRIAQIESPPEIAIHPAPQAWQYRMRANWQLDPVTRRLGYFESGSHRVCDVEVCAVLAPRLQGILERVRSEFHAGSVPVLPKDIRAVVGDDDISVAPPLAGFQTNDVSLSIAGETYSFNADSFFQVSPGLLGALIDEATGTANGADTRGAVAIDLYCGAGLFTLPLARRFARVVGVEVNERASGFALRNLEGAQLHNAEVVTANVGQWLKDNSNSLAPADFLLLDPPRVGAENIVIKGILDLQPRHISYVSCDPATLARDLKKLIAAGYALNSITAFDMFPQTHHVETVVHLARNQVA
ncbi:MAG: class I SAM-dependent RNA methyltransferase [Acidobacteriota bacterium]|nr:class I SAM-dependent RNA methyltransferase [Acidobacteriota bacterium]